MAASLRRSILALGLPVLLGPGCGGRRAPPLAPEPTEFRGHWLTAFEQSDFIPCGGSADGRIWLELPDSVRSTAGWPHGEERGSGYGGTQRRYYLRVRGELSPRPDPARAGQIRKGPARYLRVREVLEIRAPTPNDCEPRGGMMP